MRLDPGDRFVAGVLSIVEAIPPGRVMTYGDVAAVLGSRAARAVGQVMSRYGSDVPWWRVIRAGGHPPVDHEARALARYRAEGTPLLGAPDAAPDAATDAATPAAYRVDYAAARWFPHP